MKNAFNILIQQSGSSADLEPFGIVSFSSAIAGNFSGLADVHYSRV